MIGRQVTSKYIASHVPGFDSPHHVVSCVVIRCDRMEVNSFVTFAGLFYHVMCVLAPFSEGECFSISSRGNGEGACSMVPGTGRLPHRHHHSALIFRSVCCHALSQGLTSRADILTSRNKWVKPPVAKPFSPFMFSMIGFG